MLTVYENIEIAAKLSSKDKNFINKLIEEVGLKGKENKYPFQLSGGEQQRVAIARAIAKTPKVLFCDEPTGALDEENSKKILKLICKVQKEYDITIIMVTHNPLIADIADRVIYMNSSKIISDELNEVKKDVDELEWNS
jgi:putative ABC transport system ATP-binding protein